MTTHNRQQFLGLDTDYCRGRASQMRGSSEQMSGLMGNIQGLVDGVVWQGRNAERFCDNWGGTLRPQMASSTEEMDTRGRELRRRADLQDEASA